MTKLWLDDKRDPREHLPKQFPDRTWDEQTFAEWVWVKTVPEAKEVFEAGGVDEASFDHDLGDRDVVGNGHLMLDWLEEKTALDQGFEPPARMWVHSSNAAEWDRMELVIRRIHTLKELREREEGDR